jgi:hypothetical protein
MSVKDILKKFEQDKNDLAHTRKTNVSNAVIWLNNNGLQLLHQFRNDIHSTQRWSCELEVEQFGHITGNRYAKLHISDRFSRSSNDDIFITILHKNEDEDKFTVTLSNGKRSLEPRKISASSIDEQYLEEQLDKALREFSLGKKNG